jgi:hypothetical protein
VKRDANPEQLSLFDAAHAGSDEQGMQVIDASVGAKGVEAVVAEGDNTHGPGRRYINTSTCNGIPEPTALASTRRAEPSG